MKLTKLILFGIFAAHSSIVFAGDSSPDAFIGPKTKMPFSGPDTEIFVIGAPVCTKYQNNAAPNRCSAIKDCTDVGVKDLNRKITEASTFLDKFKLYDELGELHLYEGKDLLASAQAYGEMIKLARAEGKKEEQRLWYALTRKGLVHLVYGERENCINNHNKDSCIFPLSRLAQHLKEEGSEKAIIHFKEALEIKQSYHLLWMFNLAHMTLGKYPHGVPKKWRMPETALKSKTKFPRFVDAAPALGIQKYPTYGGNAVFDDFNNDGYLDLIIGGRLTCHPMAYYQNTGSGFLDRASESGLAAEIGVTNVLQADFDNDGFLDLYLARGGWDAKSFLPVQNSLMRNDGKGNFKNVTKERGMLTNNNNIATVWADFDNDGWVDLFVCNELRGADLFVNNKGRFENKIKSSGISYEGTCKGVAAGDVNNDGITDLYLAIYGRANQLYLGNGDNTFRKTSRPIIEHQPTYAFPAFFFDYDNDGWQDLFVGSFYRDMENFSRYVFGLKHNHEYQRLFKNEKGFFRDVSVEMGLTNPGPVMGGGFGDIDGDGFPEILLGAGSLSLGDLAPNMVYWNRGGKRFDDISTTSGMINLQKGHGVSVVDFDNNGKMDVLWVLGGGVPVDFSYPSLYQNPGIDHRYIVLKLEGTNSNRAAIGARIKVSIKEKGKARDVHSVVGFPSSFGNSSLRLTIGLGKAEKIENVEVLWPNKARSREVFTDLNLDKAYALKEGTGKAMPIDLPKWKVKNEHEQHHHHHH